MASARSGCAAPIVHAGALETARSRSGWVLDDSGDGVFSFARVCGTLGIDSELLRARVRERQAA